MTTVQQNNTRVEISWTNGESINRQVPPAIIAHPSPLLSNTIYHDDLSSPSPFLGSGKHVQNAGSTEQADQQTNNHISGIVYPAQHPANGYEQCQRITDGRQFWVRVRDDHSDSRHTHRMAGRKRVIVVADDIEPTPFARTWAAHR